MQQVLFLIFCVLCVRFFEIVAMDVLQHYGVQIVKMSWTDGTHCYY